MVCELCLKIWFKNHFGLQSTTNLMKNQIILFLFNPFEYNCSLKITSINSVASPSSFSSAQQKSTLLASFMSLCKMTAVLSTKAQAHVHSGGAQACATWI